VIGDLTFDVVIATTRPGALDRLVASLSTQVGPAPDRVVAIDDRVGAAEPLRVEGAEVLRGDASGPAAARNLGWRHVGAPWVAFLDDDVVLPATWSRDLVADIEALPPRAAGSQGRIAVPLPAHRRPTDWERQTAGLACARWATADMAYRRDVLMAVHGFDERFPRAYREDSDLGLRLTAAGWSIEAGRREVVHPVRPVPWTVSLRRQAGNADDALMRRLHGRRWRARAGAPRGRLARHAAIAAAGLAGLCATALGCRRTAVALGATWLAGTAELAGRRIAPGPPRPSEVATLVLTSLLIPPLAVGHRVRGELRWRLGRRPSPWRPPRPEAVLFDRDGTLIEDVPYNGDPRRVRPRPSALAAVARLRRAGVRLAVVSNQSGIARALITDVDVRAVNERVEALLGPMGPWLWCPHAADEGCGCRKPAPGLVLDAARRLHVPPERCALIGDIGADVEAAAAAGARGVLVPTPRTLPAEIAAAPERADHLVGAVSHLLEGSA
jgi:histidinol-phosphate phosphatase family protein